MNDILGWTYLVLGFFICYVLPFCAACVVIGKIEDGLEAARSRREQGIEAAVARGIEAGLQRTRKY